MSRRAPSITRKPPSSSRVPSVQTRQRTQSVVPSSSSSQVSAPTPVSRTANNAQPQEENTTNIQVVIRCRGRNAREQAENSPLIVETGGPRSEEVTIETALPQSSFGVYTPAPTRTYPFDRVFGPEADQALVYHDIVAPILEEVLNGYNCTVFAYGQTGTGKTYTMQGDLSPTLTGNPSADAGIIPRTLHKLFLHLENNVPDYSVKVSFVELYNEELRDLLVSDFKEPSSSAQPMAVAGGVGSGGLKIFDDSAKKGTFIQGLEEAHVRDAQDAVGLLRKGSERRQIAATKFNDHSSRSHSIFTLTVSTKETSSDGNDLVKTGKLHLVDLAGSENIGRSGAENKRAREAGMINQSLLTLGRVINALVERNSHVPYRESKLTRLLQDSLGGRTKTCLIATISPARSNMEETLSTLDYAFQAKAIRNRPELNARVTRNALLKEHVCEIARLKADLVATREKNGVYVSPERWREIESAQEGGKTAREELRIQAEVAQRQCRALREELEAQGGVLVKRTSELVGIRQELDQERQELTSARHELGMLQVEFEEEKVMKQAFEQNELALDRIAGALRDTAKQGVSDIKGLFDKLGRNDRLFAGNAQVLAGFSQKLQTEATDFNARLDDFLKSHRDVSHRIKSQAEAFQATELEASVYRVSNRHTQLIDGHIRALEKAIGKIHGTEQDSEITLEALQLFIARTRDGVQAAVESWAGTVSRECAALLGELAVQQEKHIGEAEKALQTACGLLEVVITDSQDYVQQNVKAAISHMHDLSRQTAEDEISRLRHQNALLTSLVEAEQIKAEHMRDDLTAHITKLIAGFVDSRNQGLRQVASQMYGEFRAGENALGTFATQHAAEVERVVDTAAGLANVLQEREQEGTRIVENGVKAIRQAQASFEDGATRVRASISSAMAGQNADVGRHLSSLDDHSTHAFNQLGSVKSDRLEITKGLLQDSRQTCQTAQTRLASSSQNVQETISTVLTNASAPFCQTLKTTTNTHVTSLQQISKGLLSDVKNQDVPTGQTPRKRRWDYVDSWALTGDRETVLRAWKNRDATPSLTASITASDEVKSEADTLFERELAAKPGHMRTGSAGSELSEMLKAEPQSDVDMDANTVQATRIAKPSSSSGMPPPLAMRRGSTMMPMPSGKFSGITDENVVTRSKRVKRFDLFNMLFTHVSAVAAGAVFFWTCVVQAAPMNQQVIDCEAKCSQRWSFPAPAPSAYSSTKTKTTTHTLPTPTYAPPPKYTPEPTSTSVVVHNAHVEPSSSTKNHVAAATQAPKPSTSTTPAPAPAPTSTATPSKPDPIPSSDPHVEPSSSTKNHVAAATQTPKPSTSTTPAPAPAPTSTTAPAKADPVPSSSSPDIAAYLDPHNAARAAHGAAPLTWSDELAAAAQRWANGCVFEHSGGKLGPYGENLAAGSGDYSPQSGVKAWVDEAPEYSSSSPVPSHFTQVVWKATSQVGCAVASCNLANFDKQFWPVKFHVCEYSSAGNVIGQFAQNVQA
ncbi:kinesin motor protein cin8 [Ceratobasidium sp. 370]|nr:kinesin motor protein cin8 [Ceratobasidium sp. 370]